MIHFKVITLCGSLKKAEKHFSLVQILLERKGHVCFSVCASQELADLPSESEKKILDKVHYKKISLSDCILVLDIDGYIGESTKGEIEWAELNNIPVYYYSNSEYFNSILLGN